MELTRPAPLGAHASLLANTPVRKPPDSSKVEAAPGAGKPRADMHNTQTHHDVLPAPERKTSTAAEAGAGIDPDTLTGPPPSFQLNVLELDQKLQQKLARLESGRTRDQQFGTLAPQPSEDDGSGRV